MAAWTVTFLGATVIAGGEGVIESFVPGKMQNVYAIEGLPRGVGGVVHHLGKPPAAGRMVVVFLVAKAGVAGIKTRMEALDTPLLGALVVPDFGTYPSCVMTACVPGQVMAELVGASEGYSMPYELEFAQVYVS